MSADDALRQVIADLGAEHARHVAAMKAIHEEEIAGLKAIHADTVADLDAVYKAGTAKLTRLCMVRGCANVVLAIALFVTFVAGWR